MKRVALLLCLPSIAFAQDIELPHTLSNNSVADADEVMANFNVLLAKANGDDSRIAGIEAIISLDNSPFEEGELDIGVANGVWEGDEKQGNLLLGLGTTTAVLKTTENAFNTSLGVDTLSSLSRGFSNVAIGYRAMRDASGTQTDPPAAISSNVAVGAFALEDLRDYPGIGNTAIGDRAMWRAISANANTGVGAEVLQQLTTGYGNVGVGNTGLRGTTTGGRNVALGLRALGDNITGSDNIAVGFRADVTAPNLFNATVIGANAKVDASNKIQLGNTSVTSVATSGKLTTGDVTYPKTHGTSGQVLATNGSGELVWTNNSGVGETGPQGPKGDKGDTGAQGPKGDTGPQGPAVNLSEAGLTFDSDNANLAVGDGLQNVTPGAPFFADGVQNTSLGRGALYNNTAGSMNTASGAYALSVNRTGDFNTATGSAALSSNYSGSQNTATGASALEYNSTGSGNTATGSDALFSNTTGYRNTAIGNNALKNNVDGWGNTALGHQAMESGSEGPNARNVAVGANALRLNTENANSAFGWNALSVNTTGVGNTALGHEAMTTNATGSNNIAIGSQANVSADNLSNAIVIGVNAVVNASNKVRLGNTEVTVIEGEVAFTSSSDARLKDSISPVNDGLALINDLKPVSYHRKNNPESDIEMGLLAQEVEAALEKHGLGNSGMVHQPTEEAYMSLRYNDLMAPMIRAIQELDDASEAKDAQIASLQNQLQSQQQELLALVQSQQEQIAQLQRMVEHQFTLN